MSAATDRTGSSGAPETPVPEQVHAAWWLWIAAAVFAVLGAVVSASTSRMADLPPETREQLDDVVEQVGAAGRELSPELLFGLAMALSVVFALAVAGLCVFLAHRMRAGRFWARSLLDVAAVMLVVFAMLAVYGVLDGTVSPGHATPALVSFLPIACQVLAGLCGGVALAQQRSAAASEFFESRNGQATR